MGGSRTALLALGLAVFLLAGCPDGTTVPLTGTVHYQRVPTTTTGGLDYTRTVERPVRGATIRVIDDDGEVADRAILDTSGRFALDVPKDQAFTLEVLAQLGHPDAPEVVIRDNTDDNRRYLAAVELPARSRHDPIEIVIESGWTGSAYGEPRAAAPFAILDTVYAARALVLDARPDFDFVDQSVYWSEDNTASASLNYAAGLIQTSHYNFSTGGVYILGDADVDTDEYDAAVVAHEWIHYFEDQHARSDSIGGSHSATFSSGSTLSSNDILDDTVAFGEGFATAMGGLINDDRDYMDTAGASQATTAVHLDLERDSMSDSATTSDGRLYDGYWSEFSVMEIVWDLADGGSSDDDSLELGAAKLIDALLDGQADTPYFTSLYTYLYHLKRQPRVRLSEEAAIDAIAAAENVYEGNEYHATDGSTPDGYRRYTTIDDDGMVVTTDMDGNTLESLTTYGTTGNRLFNRVYFRGTASSTGTHTIKAWPTDDTLSMRVWRPGDRSPDVLDDPYEWTVALAAGELLVFAIEWRSGGAAAADDFDLGWFPPGATVPKIAN